MDDMEDDKNHVTEDVFTVEEILHTENNTQLAIPWSQMRQPSQFWTKRKVLICLTFGLETLELVVI